MTRRLKLRKLKNARDLGGLPAEGGKHIVCGKLVRSGQLYALPAKTLCALERMGVTKVVDLRIPAESVSKPDTVPAGCEYIQQPLLCTPTVGITSEPTLRQATENLSKNFNEDFGTADNYMIKTYHSILFNEEPKAGLRVFLRIVIEQDGCMIFHCASGKDRAGICAMLIEALLGVDEEHILHDYMLSRAPFRWKYALNRSVLIFLPVSIRYKRLLFGLMRTRPLYLRSVIDEMKRKYGGIVEYCKAELGVTEADIAALKQKYLV